METIASKSITAHNERIMQAELLAKAEMAAEEEKMHLAVESLDFDQIKADIEAALMNSLEAETSFPISGVPIGKRKESVALVVDNLAPWAKEEEIIVAVAFDRLAEMTVRSKVIM